MTVEKIDREVSTKKMTFDDVRLPDSSGEDVTTLDDEHGLIWFVGADHDIPSDHPSDDDGFGKFHSMGRRHMNFNEDCGQILVDNPDAVALSYFEHGNCIWDIQGELSGTPDFRWDGVDFAGVWEPSDDVNTWAAEMGHKPGTVERAQWMRDLAKSQCVVYTAWCNGEVYGYGVSVFKSRLSDDGNTFDDRDDYRFDEAVHEDSCCGFYGWEDLESAIKESVQGIFEEVDKPAEDNTANTE